MSSPRDALRAGAIALARCQEDGHWEGEMRWCPMLTAQYVIFHHVLGRPIDEERKRRILQYFERVQHEDGLWGLHDHSGPSLFVTTLVYVGARLAGAPADAPWLAEARALFARERVVTVPTWGRVWLALLGLYAWEGIHPMPPELWALPRSLPFHPSRFYCHTRMIYLGLGLLRAEAKSPPVTPLLAALREELHPGVSYASIDFRSHRSTISRLDLVAPHHPVLRAGYALAEAFERLHLSWARRLLSDELRERVRWELRTTDHMGVSPVSGMLGMLALASANPRDPVVLAGLASLDQWSFDDATDGFRLTGARSQTWDTAFAVQALVAASPVASHGRAVRLGVEYLARQQIAGSFRGFAEAHRIDPDGGFCFAHREHGWPVSDCTAEALSALLAVGDPSLRPDRLHAAVSFVLRCQNDDGGFGSYEARRGGSHLDALNPSEMFLECMTEHSYVECTASSVLALCEWRERFPSHVLRPEVDAAVASAVRFLRRAQSHDGSWEGAWGIHRIYGTMFGVRALRTAGASPDDPAIANAVTFLLSVQRADGGFGEHESSATQPTYVDLGRSHPVQTSWAMIALIESGAPVGDAVDRAASFLASAQRPDGTWNGERMVGVFFRTSLVDYDLYRLYFPVWALGLHERAQKSRGASTSRGDDRSHQHVS